MHGQDRGERAPTQLAFHASRIIIDVGVLITLGAMSLPFVETESGTRDSISADALPALLLLIPVFLITLIPDHTRPVPGPLGWFSLVLGIAAFPYAIVKFLDASTVAETLDGSVGLGARLLVFGTFVTLLGIGVGLARGVLHLPSGGSYPAIRPPARRPVSPPASRQQPNPAGRPVPRTAAPEQPPASRGTPPADRTRAAQQRPPGTPTFRPNPGPGTRPPSRDD